MKCAAVVVNHNGGRDLERCLSCLREQVPRISVVVVDCVSSDGSRRLAEEPPDGVTGLPLQRNVGYAGGCAAGLAAIDPGADVVGFFNPDCFPSPTFFATCLATFERDPTAGGVAGRLVRDDEATLDSCGQVLSTVTLMVRDRGYGLSGEGRFREADRVLAACGAAMVYRRAALEAVAVNGAVFPEEFFAFWEDVDLGWRVSNAGWRVVYEPGAIAIHRRAGGAAAPGGRLILLRPPQIAAGILVNRWATLLRNLHTLDFAVRLPVLWAWDMAMVLYLVARRPAAAGHLVRMLPRVRLAWRQRPRLPRRRLSELP